MAPATSFYKTETVFDYPWRQVVQAYWNRYPNPSSAHVLTEDTIKREVRDGKLYSRRILSKTNKVPKWGERFYKNTPIKILEDSVLDLKKKTLTTFTRNIGFKKIMKVDEVVEYMEQKDGRTLAVRRAYISSQVFGFSRAIRAFGVERFKSNCSKTVNGFNYVLQNMFPNGQLTPTPAKASTLPTESSERTVVIQSTNHHSTNNTTNDSHSISHTPNNVVIKASTAGYDFLKCQLIKIAQLLSVKN